MNSQMEQLFKVLLLLVMVAILGGVFANYMEDNYSSFDVESTVDNDLIKDYNKGNHTSYTEKTDGADGPGDISKANEDNIGMGAIDKK